MDRKLDLDLYVYAAMEDSRSLHGVLDALIALRKENSLARLTQNLK